MTELFRKIYLKFQLQKLPKWAIVALLGFSALCFYQVYLEIRYLTSEAVKGAPCEDCSK